MEAFGATRSSAIGKLMRITLKTLLALTLLTVASAASAQRSLDAADVVTSPFSLESNGGVPINGFPSWDERVVHEWINRARVDPQIEMTQCGKACPDAACYRPKPPLPWSDALGRAARFHAAEMLTSSYFAHDSRCTVVPNIATVYPIPCAGGVNCGCVGAQLACSVGGCTKWYDRVGLFGVYATGEIIAAPPEPNSAFYLWLYEPTAAATCQFSGTNGHRFTILQSDGVVGVGTSEAAAVGDFGRGEAESGVVSAAHYPRSGTSVEVWANWYGSAAPKSASVVVDGICTPLKLLRGSGTNGAWSATLHPTPGRCSFYYVSFTDVSGNVLTYPESGSYAIGAGSCGDWSPSRNRSTCAARPTRKRPVRR